MKRLFPFACAALSVAGCQSLHTADGGGEPVAVWSSLQPADGPDRPSRPGDREAVARALAGAGLHATVHDGGVAVPAGEERLAREVLLTDRSLAGTGVSVLLLVPAGSARRTAAGFEVPEVAPVGASRN